MSSEEVRRRRPTVLLLFGLASAFVAAVALGAVRIPLGETIRILIGAGPVEPASAHQTIILSLRLPRAMMATVTGASLAISGALLQGLFRNPLASPYLLGLASGASTGAAIALLLGAAGTFLLPLGAFGGALGATFLVAALSATGPRGGSSLFVILAGVAVGSLFSAVTSLVVFLAAGSDRALDVVFWMMGGLGRSTWQSVSIAGGALALALAASSLFARPLDILSIGEREARHLGVSLSALRYGLIAVTALATGASVAFVGTIGFIGLVAPHAARLAFGPEHRRVLPYSAILGATTLLVADTLARVALAPAELPVGIVTSFFGVPFLLFLLWRGRRSL